MEVGKRYVRTSPTGQETIIVVTNGDVAAYMEDMEKEGYKHKEVMPSNVVGSVCESCEG